MSTWPPADATARLQKKKPDVAGFYQQDYIGLDKTSGNRNLLDQRVGHIRPERPSICETRHVTTMLGMVESRDRHCGRSRHVNARAEHSLLTSVPLTEPEVRRTVGLIRRRGRIQSYIAAELETLITEQYREVH